MKNIPALPFHQGASLAAGRGSFSVLKGTKKVRFQIALVSRFSLCALFTSENEK